LPGQQVEQSCLFPHWRSGQAIVPLAKELPHLVAQRREFVKPHLEFGEPLCHQSPYAATRDIAVLPLAQYTRQFRE
jgi:hypothetical protein